MFLRVLNRTVLSTLAVAALFAVLPAAASAAAVRSSSGDSGEISSTLFLTGDSGEVNAFEVEDSGVDRARVRDANPIRDETTDDRNVPGSERCRRISPNELECPVEQIIIDANDRDDAIDVDPVCCSITTLEPGAGSDTARLAPNPGLASLFLDDGEADVLTCGEGVRFTGSSENRVDPEDRIVNCDLDDGRGGGGRDDDDDGNGGGGDDDDGGDDESAPAGSVPSPPPAEATRIAGIECGIFNQNFVRDNTVGRCTAAGAQGLLGPQVPALTVCVQASFSGRQPRGFARSDLEACETRGHAGAGALLLRVPLGRRPRAGRSDLRHPDRALVRPRRRGAAHLIEEVVMRLG